MGNELTMNQLENIEQIINNENNRNNNCAFQLSICLVGIVVVSL